MSTVVNTVFLCFFKTISRRFLESDSKEPAVGKALLGAGVVLEVTEGVHDLPFILSKFFSLEGNSFLGDFLKLLEITNGGISSF